MEMRCRPISGVKGELKPTSVATQMPHSPFIEIFKMLSHLTELLVFIMNSWIKSA